MRTEHIRHKRMSCIFLTDANQEQTAALTLNRQTCAVQQRLPPATPSPDYGPRESAGVHGWKNRLNGWRRDSNARQPADGLFWETSDPGKYFCVLHSLLKRVQTLKTRSNREIAELCTRPGGHTHFLCAIRGKKPQRPFLTTAK